VKACRKNSIDHCLFNFCPQSAAYSTFLHKKPNPIQINQEFQHLRAAYVTLRPYFLYKKLLIKSFIFSETNTFGLPKFSKISFTFNIFVPVPVQEMVYLKAIQKITPIDVSVSWTIDQKSYLKKFRGGFSPLSPPWNPYGSPGLMHGG